MTTTLHFLRHGDTEASAEGMFSGDLDPPLAPSGVEQAARLAVTVKGLRVRSLYVSPKLRARQTAEPTARATGLEPRIEEGLREIGYGAWEGRSEREIAAAEPEAFALWSGDPGTHAPPGGESGLVIAARAMPIVSRILVEHKDEEVALFSHKATIRILTCVLLGIEVSRFRDRVACPTASLTSFAFGPRGPMLLRLGATV